MALCYFSGVPPFFVCMDEHCAIHRAFVCLCTPDAPNLIADRQSESACIYGSRKIDLIITKSISRFARNTITVLETVRELKILGIDVYFQEQNIHSISADGELMLSILSSYAQEESFSASENQKWRIRKDFEQGKICNIRMLGYCRTTNGSLEIVESEAEIVRFIFLNYLSIAENSGFMPSTRSE